jgi:D-alanyl-D-alanine carboxypeptidase
MRITRPDLPPSRAHVARHRLVPRLTAAVATAALLVTAACGDGATAPRGGRVPAALQRTVDSIATAARIPGVVVVVRRPGGAGFTLTSGVADLQSRRPVRAPDRFRVASVTKPMVATVVLQLVDEGRLALDAPLAVYLPGLVPGAADITVRQLLNHTTGLPDYTNDDAFLAQVFADPGRSWTPHELLAVANGMAPAFAPGAPGRWAYANTNYIVLGLLVEQVSRRTLAQELQARVFERLGMRSTSYSTSPLLPAPYAEGYADVADAQRDVPVGTLVSPTWGGAAGAVVSTADDLARFAEALAAGTLLSPAMHAERLRTVAASVLRFPEDSYESAYGLGVLTGGGWVGHNGAIPGYEAEAFARPGVGAVVVLVNRTTETGASHAIFAAVRDASFGAP